MGKASNRKWLKRLIAARAADDLDSVPIDCATCAECGWHLFALVASRGEPGAFLICDGCHQPVPLEVAVRVARQMVETQGNA
jgi:hypothetical protein